MLFGLERSVLGELPNCSSRDSISPHIKSSVHIVKPATARRSNNGAVGHTRHPLDPLKVVAAHSPI